MKSFPQYILTFTTALLMRSSLALPALPLVKTRSKSSAKSGFTKLLHYRLSQLILESELHQIPTGRPQTAPPKIETNDSTGNGPISWCTISSLEYSASWLRANLVYNDFSLRKVMGLGKSSHILSRTIPAIPYARCIRAVPTAFQDRASPARGATRHNTASAISHVHFQKDCRAKRLKTLLPSHCLLFRFLMTHLNEI